MGKLLLLLQNEWIKRIQRSEILPGYLAENEIYWQFNLAIASWWRGIFERMIAIMKNALYKSIGRAVLTFKEMEDVMLETQMVMNNRPLSYCEGDVRLSMLTPNVLIWGKEDYLLNENPLAVEEKDRKNVQNVWRSVRTHSGRDGMLSTIENFVKCIHSGKIASHQPGDIDMIKGDERNRARWRVGKVNSLIQGRDRIVRGVRLISRGPDIERSIQFFYPLEIELW